MKATAVTVSIGVGDLDQVVAWYRSALGLREPDLVPAKGMVEFDLGAFWLQVAEAPDRAGVNGVGLNLSVKDVHALQVRLRESHLDVSAVERYEGVVDYCQLIDPDGNTIGLITELS